MVATVAAYQDEFLRGRKEGFEKIRLALNGVCLPEITERVIRVYVTYARGDDSPNELILDTQVDLSYALRLMRERLEHCLERFENGENLLEITDLEDIPSYKAVTGGDERAGIQSAVTDFSALVNVIDFPGALILIKKSVRVHNDNYADDKYFTDAGNNFSGLLLTAFEDIGKKYRSQRIEYADNGRTVKTGRARLFEIAAQRVMSGLAFLKAHKEPPLFSHTLHRFMIAAEKMNPIVVKEEAENHNTAFVAGFQAALRKMYEVLNEKHFRMTEFNEYPENVGLVSSWAQALDRSAGDIFSKIRHSLNKKLTMPATGSGESFKDGAAAAEKWMALEISRLKNGEKYCDIIEQQVVSKILAFWQKSFHVTTDAIIAAPR